MGWTLPTTQNSTPVPARTIAAAIIRESRVNGRAVQKRVLVGAVVCIAVLIYLGVVALLYRTQQTGPGTMAIRPLSATTIAAIYAGLGATVVALQFGARTAVDVGSGNAILTARILVQRSFLGGLAWMALLTSVTVGCLTAFWYSGLPEHIDLPRTAGPLLASTFLAFSAAETQLLMESPLDADVRRLLLNQRIRLLRHRIRNEFPQDRRRRMLLWRGVGFILVPTICTAVSGLIIPAAPGVLTARFGIIIASTLAAYWMMLDLTRAIAERHGTTAVGIVVIGALVGLAVLLSVVEAELRVHGGATTYGDLARGIIGMWVMAVVVPFAAMNAAATRTRRWVGFIVYDARWVLERKLHKLTAPKQVASRRPQLGRLVVWAWLTTPVFPFGVLLGRAAAADAIKFGHRGARGGIAAAWTCAIFAAICTAATVFIALAR